MRTDQFYLNRVGPISEQSFDFTDEWSGDVNTRSLFSGPNGCGKTIILRAIATLWDATGHWLDERKVLPRREAAFEWLQRWGGVAMLLSGLPHTDLRVGRFFGETPYLERLRQLHPSGIEWIGEHSEADGNGEYTRRKLLVPKQRWVDEWAEYRRKMVLTFDDARTPNMIYLDAEERRWVSPRRNLGKAEPDDSTQRWLVTYRATEDWKGQLEASLLALKTAEPRTFDKTVDELNRLFVDKRISHEVKRGENRLRVVLGPNSGKQYHFLDDLSAGEHQVMIVLYLVSRWLERGGIVLIDEPDLHLHPSLVPSLLSQLELLVEERDGQLIVTSHNPEVWSRYRSRGLRVQLGGCV